MFRIAEHDPAYSGAETGPGTRPPRSWWSDFAALLRLAIACRGRATLLDCALGNVSGRGMSQQPPRAAQQFHTTHWSLVARAGAPPGQEQRRALGELVARYLPALRAHLVAYEKIDPHEADDLLN